MGLYDPEPLQSDKSMPDLGAEAEVISLVVPCVRARCVLAPNVEK